jgi:hypothetical protein
MHKTIPPALKGLLTAIIMIAVVMAIYYGGDKVDPRLQYLIYAIYAGGVIWTLVAYRVRQTLPVLLAGFSARDFVASSS